MAKLTDTTDELKELASQHEILSSMVLAKQEQLKQLDHQSTLLTVALAKMKDDHAQETSAHTRKLQIASEEHTKGLEQERFALKQRENELNSREHNIELEAKDAKELIDRAEPVKAILQQISDERIDLEQQRVRTGEIQQQAEQLQQVYTQRMTELLERENVVKALETKHTSLAQEFESRETELSKTQASVTKDLDTLAKVREEIDPKLKALTEREQAVKDQVVRAETLHGEALQKSAEQQQLHADLQGLAQRLEQREKILNDFNSNLRRFSQELTLKAQEAKAKGIDVGTVPAEPPSSPP